MNIMLEDKHQVLSPDKIEIDLSLAGLGSRALAYLVDNLIKSLGLIIIIIFVFLSGLSSGFIPEDKNSSTWLIAILAILVIVIYAGYNIFFECLWNGQTLGKKLVKIRVVMDNGQSVSIMAVFVRNLLRLVDILPTNYLLGGLVLLISSKNQRLGDMVAGTVVVNIVDGRLPTVNKYSVDVTPAIREVAWSLPVKEMEIIRAFLERREGMKKAKEKQLATVLAEKIAAKLMLPKQDIKDDLLFLKQVLAGYAMGPMDENNNF